MAWRRRSPSTKVAKLLAPLEYPIHCSIVTTAEMELAPEVIWCHVPNGFNAGSRGYIEWAKMQAMGAMAGWPDLQFFWPVCRAMFMEIKRPGEKPEPHQHAIHARLRAQGWIVVVVDNLDDARKAWADAGIPTKGHRLPGGGMLLNRER